MVTTFSSGQIVTLVATLAVTVLLAPALIYAHTWLQAAKRSRTQQAKKSRRGKLMPQSLPGRNSGPRTWPEHQAQPSIRVK